MDFRLDAVGFDALSGWTKDDMSGLGGAIARCHVHIRDVKSYRTGSLGIDAQALAAAFAQATSADFQSADAARSFFEANFTPFRITPKDGRAGLVTAFYEPVVEVSDTRSGRFCHPFYRCPEELVDVDDVNRPEGFDPNYAFGRSTKGAIDYFPERSEIDSGYLEGRGLEIAWAASRVDVFFAHVQGAARLRYPDGSVRRITYAAKAGHPFSGIGRHLADIGEIPLADVSMQSIRAWLSDHPERQDEILWHNRSYIFFREVTVADDRLGPIAAAKVQLEPMRSIAVDRLIHTFGSLFYISSPSLTHLAHGRPFNRLMIALDTGTAIVGPTRADIFTGSGLEAGNLAGNVKNEADFYILIPKSVASRYL
jgi:membrane-bound lytic murein transglycosylase A